MSKLYHKALLLQLFWISNAHSVKAVKCFVKQAFTNEMLFVDYDLLTVENTHDNVLEGNGHQALEKKTYETQLN